MLDYKGMVRIKCTSEIPGVYNGLANVSLNTGRLLPASAYGAKATLISHPGKNSINVIKLLECTFQLEEKSFQRFLSAQNIKLN